jgi:lon-related putative ATP-dependent protease
MPFSPHALRAAQLRNLCDPAIFDFADTSTIDPLEAVIGQERAVRSIHLGLNMNQPGYNMFITGIEGTGKRTIVQEIVSRHAKTLPTPEDWCLVNNFDDEFRPIAISVPTGRATAFAKATERLIRGLRTKLSEEFETDAHKEKTEQLKKQFSEQESKVLERLDELAAAKQIHIAKTTEGLQPIPLLNDKPMTEEQFEQLSTREQDDINERLRLLSEEMEKGLAEIVKIKQALQKAADQLAQDSARLIVSESMLESRKQYECCAPVQHYLDAVLQDIVEAVEAFIAPDNETRRDPESPFQMPDSRLNRYKVNVLADRKAINGAPVVFEPNPTFQNLFGRIDSRLFMGAAATDFTMVQAGSLLAANGGYLIVEIEALLMDLQVWESLKRALQNKQLCIEEQPHQAAVFAGGLRPQPIQLEVKAILVGNYQTFEVLQNFDTKFNKIFKVRADFDYETGFTADTARQYAQFIARACREYHLRPFTPRAVAAVVAYGQQVVASQTRISLRLGPIVGLIQESDYWAASENARQVTETHVARAIAEYRFRYNLYEEKIHADYVEDTVIIDVHGEAVGQVNALTVYQVGEISFGRPSRITAETFMGRHGLVNIEREARMSGHIHDKGVMILSGYLGRTFARKYPLTLSISITFEQNYSAIDGDSASSTELYAILSSLSDQPIQQGLAVTGSVNQKGQIQAIGGVNQKIEGFYEVCKTKGIDGRQGVLIPRANVRNLMLNQEVVQAVEQNRFHIYAVESVEEGIEILTGTPAGMADDQGDYAPWTLFGKVQRKLEHYLRQSLKLKSWQNNDGGEGF